MRKQRRKARRRTKTGAYDLTGCTFGPLRILFRAGDQSGNSSWFYHCRECGHVGHRLGVRFQRGPDRCPKCGSEQRKGPWQKPEVDKERYEQARARFPGQLLPEPGKRSALDPKKSRGSPRLPDVRQWPDSEIKRLIKHCEAELEVRVRVEEKRGG